MTSWLRASVVSLVGALLGGAACGGSDSAVTITPGCSQLFCATLEIPSPPDGPSLCAQGGPCNYQTQEGCGAGETCAPKIDNDAQTVTPACRPVGTQGRGEECDSPSVMSPRVCGKGLICIHDPADADKNVGSCRKLCCGADWTGCDPGESCIRQLNVRYGTSADAPTEYAKADLCYPVNNCDLLDPEACKDQNRVCRIADPVGNVACMPPDNGQLGESCTKAAQCGPVMHCVKKNETDPSGTCRRLCPWGECASPECPKEEGVCVHFNRDPSNVGECTQSWHGAPLSVDDAGHANLCSSSPAPPSEFGGDLATGSPRVSLPEAGPSDGG